VSGKCTFIYNVIADNGVNFLVLSKTWFNPDMPVSIMKDNVPAPGYLLLHVPRPIVSGGVTCNGSLSRLLRLCRRTPSSIVLSIDVRTAPGSRGLVPLTIRVIFNIY